MIKFKHPVPKWLRDFTVSRGDFSFTRSVSLLDSDLPPLPEEFKGAKYSLDTAIMLKHKGFVAPHNDLYTGAGEPYNMGAFWLLKTSSAFNHLMVENETVNMVEGDIVFFDDRKLHTFMSNATWSAVAVQLETLEFSQVLTQC